MVVTCFGTVRFCGAIGVLLARFLSWILARSILEKRGLTWAWFIHFVQDELVFGSWGSARSHGGG
jgi:hypothetical protein